MLETSPTLVIGGRNYQIRALGSKEGTDLLPLVSEVLAPAMAAFLEAAAKIAEGGEDNMSAAAGPLARALQGAPKYPALATAAMRHISHETAEGPGRWIPLSALDTDVANSEFFSRRQFEKARLVFEFVKWNYSDFFDGIKQLAPNIGIVSAREGAPESPGQKTSTH